MLLTTCLVSYTSGNKLRSCTCQSAAIFGMGPTKRVVVWAKSLTTRQITRVVAPSARVSCGQFGDTAGRTTHRVQLWPTTGNLDCEMRSITRRKPTLEQMYTPIVSTTLAGVGILPASNALFHDVLPDLVEFGLLDGRLTLLHGATHTCTPRSSERAAPEEDLS